MLALFGTALLRDKQSAVTLLLLVLFQVLTAPVISQLVGRAAYRGEAVDRDALVVDEMAEWMRDGEGHERQGPA
jgi:multicomponent Na+:H+ antiporter subunit G